MHLSNSETHDATALGGCRTTYLRTYMILGGKYIYIYKLVLCHTYINMCKYKNAQRNIFTVAEDYMAWHKMTRHGMMLYRYIHAVLGTRIHIHTSTHAKTQHENQILRGFRGKSGWICICNVPWERGVVFTFGVTFVPCSSSWPTGCPKLRSASPWVLMSSWHFKHGIWVCWYHVDRKISWDFLKCIWNR